MSIWDPVQAGWISVSARQRIAAVVAVASLLVLLAHPGLYSRETAYGVAMTSVILCWLFTLPANRSLGPYRPLLVATSVFGLAICLSLWSHGQLLSSALVWPFSQLLLLWLGWWLSEDERALRPLAQALLVGTALIGAYAFLQSGGADPLPPATLFEDRRVVSVFENPNFLGNFVAGALPLLAVFFLQAADNRRRLGTGAVIALAYGACLLAGSRGAWLAGIGGLLLVALGLARSLHLGTLRLHWRSLGILVLALVAVTIFALQRPVIANARGKVSVGERLLSSRYIVQPRGRDEGTQASPATSVRLGDVQVHDTTINHRYFIWQIAWDMVRDRPLLGVGYGEFDEWFPRFREARRDRADALFGSLVETQQYENTRYAHNEYLHLWAECGLLGLTAFLALISVALLAAWRRAWTRADLVLWAMLGTLGVMLIHSMVSYPLRLPANGMLFWLVLGMAARLGRR